ncbi:MFS transporter [Allorhizocola rhizosphaerae]|uniref:MFS transporter n=1 Tax=Allorhizocola rhizosphaerae TaxID=1872709 RepID=UPI000E3DEF57|nr:MFS transporter [Allorhizocola rhizosphaerae]
MTQPAQKSGIPLWLIALFFLTFAIGTDDFVIAGVLRDIADDLAVSEAVAGQLITAFSIVYAVVAPLAAVVLARWSRRPTMIAITLVFAALNVLMAVAPSYSALLGLRILAAIAAAAVTPAAFATAAMMAPPNRQGSYIGMVAAGLTVSLVVGVPLGTWIGGAFGWQSTMLFVAALLVLAALGMTALPREGRPPAIPLRVRLAPLGRPAIMVGLLGTAIAASGGLMFYAYIGPVSNFMSGASTGTLAVLIAVAGVCGAIGTVLGGRLADAWGPDRTLVSALAVQVLATLLAAVLAWTIGAGQVPVVAIGALLAVWAIAGWALNPPVQMRLLMLAGDAGMEVVALNSSALYVGISVAGAAGGTALALLGPQGVPLIAGLLGFCALVLFVLAFQVFRLRVPDQSAPAASGEGARADAHG